MSDDDGSHPQTLLSSRVKLMLFGLVHQSGSRELKERSRPPFAYQEYIHVYLTRSVRADQTGEVDHTYFLSSPEVYFTLSNRANHIGPSGGADGVQ